MLAPLILCFTSVVCVLGRDALTLRVSVYTAHQLQPQHPKPKTEAARADV